MNAPSKVAAESLAVAYVEAFSSIEAATKDAKGQVGQQKYKYADLSSVISAIKPALIKHGLAFTQPCEPSADGVTVRTILHHTSGETLDLGSLYVPANKRDAQGFGSALTYARRYALVSAFGVPTEDDDGDAATASMSREPLRQEARVKGPFPSGPASGISQLKAMSRPLYRDLQACGDADELQIVIANNKELLDQIEAGWPDGWEGIDGDGNKYPGFRELTEQTFEKETV